MVHISFSRFRVAAFGVYVCLLLLGSPSISLGSSADSSPADRPTINEEEYHGAAGRHLRRSVAKVRPLIDRYGSWAAAAAILAEGIGIPVPGQTLLLASSMEAGRG